VLPTTKGNTASTMAEAMNTPSFLLAFIVIRTPC
jgi:hypothetical protein